MSQKVQKTIEINAKVKTSLEDMSKTIRQLEDGLSKQKFDLGKTSGLSKLIKDYKEAKTELDELMQGDQIARADIKKAENLGDKVSKLYKKIATSFKELQGGNEEVFKNLFPSKFVTQITKGTQAIDKFFQKLDAKGIKNTKVTDLTKEVQTLETELSQLKNRRIKVEIDVDKENVSKELQRINKEFDNMRQNFKKKLFPDEEKDSKGRTNTQKLDSSVATWSNKLTQDREARKNLKVADLTKAQKTQITKLEGQLTDSAGSSLIEGERKRLQALQAEQRKRETIAKTPGARDTSRSRREYGGVADKELSAQIAASEKELQRLKAIADKIEDIKQQPQKAYDAAVKNLETRIKTDRTNLEKAEKALAEHQSRREEEEKIATQKTEDFMSGKSTAEATQEEIEALKKLNQERQEAINLEKELKQEEGFKSQESKDSAISKKESTIANKRREIEALNNEIKNLTNETNLDEFFQRLGELGVNTEGIEHTHEGLEQIKKDLKDLNTQTTEAIRKQLLELGYDSQEADKMVDALGKGMEELGDKDKDLKRAENEMENLKNQVLQFFSLTNSVQLFKRAVAGALNTVKELDATMTEAAVVTDFSVGDMWDKLPQYSAEAQKLGVSINGMYQATTLYYQQGLKTNEAMALGIETMKMGKIASMDSTEATKAMTAALRGFNMELNETSATRVNDVYSQLAAVTAADTNQIATAMEKTASIAAAANMEFETTAALLAQIIETTQEAPETAGTAMKTIIARFSEVKALQNQGEATGTDEEGESIDVNKIQTALKTVGISMDNFFAGTEGLDSILLKLAEKWDTLDFETQRYVATMAAGSRQQSRFIAMMSDYGRTMELVDSANNSAGASQRQYEKTLDSMESKLQRLENAWNEFLMSLANNDILKGAVDFLTWIIEGINKMTDSISGGNGLIKSITSLITVIGALKLGKQAIGSAGFAQALGGLTGKTDTIKETITETKGPGDSIVRTIIKEPVKEGELAGQQAGQGFVAGFKRAVAAKKEGANILGSMKAMFITGEKPIEEKYNNQGRKKRIEKKYNNQGKKKLTNAKNKKEFISELVARNSGAEEGQKIKASVLKKEVLTVFETEGAEAAVAKYEQLGGSLRTVSENEKMASEQSKTLGLNMNAMGQAAMGVGALLGGLSAIFEELGMEEAAEATSVLASVFMGLGTVMTTLSSIAPMLGISFTTAGVQIGAAGATAAAGGAAATIAWLPLIAIIGAIIVAVMIVIALFKAAKDASDEGQIEKLNEQIEALGAAADEAKNKLQEMASAKEELGKLQDTFQGLTKGSKEWKQALIENNQKVLELLDTYPQLAEYVSKGINGELIIAEEGWEKMQDQQQVAYTSALNAKTAKIQQKEEQELEFETRDFLLEAQKKQDPSKQPAAVTTHSAADTTYAKTTQPSQTTQPTATTTHSAADTTYAKTTQPSQPVQSTSRYITNDEMQAFAAAAAERGVSFSGGSGKEAFRQVFTDLRETGVIGEDVNFDTFYSQISNLGSSFDELANSAMATSVAEEARADSIAANVAQTSELVQSSKEFGAVAEEMGSQAFTNYDDRVVEAAEDYTTALGNESKAAYEDTLQEYADNQNMTLDEVKKQIKDGTLSKETIANTLAARDVDNEMKNAMEGTVKFMEKISKGKSKQDVAEIKGLMTDRGLGMGIDSIENMPKDAEGMKKYFKELLGHELTEEEAQSMGYGSVDAFIQAMVANSQDAKAAFDNIFKEGMETEFKDEILELNGALKNLGSASGLTVAQTQKLTNSLEAMAMNGGDVEALLKQFPQLLAGLGGQELENAINILANTDWSTQASIDSTVEALKAFGVAIDDEMVKKLREVSKATKELNFQAIEGKLSRLSSLEKSLREKIDSGSKVFTKEERDELIAEGADHTQFVRVDFDEYVFMGETNNLLSDIEAHTRDILGEISQTLDQKITEGENFERVFQSNKTYAAGNGVQGNTDGITMTGGEIIEKLASGEYDVLDMGTTWNIGTETLDALIKDTGMDIDTDGWSDQEKAKALVNKYNSVYGENGAVLRENRQTKYEEGAGYRQMEYSEVVGTDDYYNINAEQDAKEKRERLYSLGEKKLRGKSITQRDYENMGAYGDIGFGNITGGQVDWATEDSATAFIEYNPQELLKAIAEDPNFAKKYSDSLMVKEAMEQLAALLEIEGSFNMDFVTLQQELANYYNDINAGELALDAYIQKEAGLDTALQSSTQQLEDSNSELADNTVLLKQLTVGHDKANKSMDKLNSVLDDEIDAFKAGEKAGARYDEALSKITSQAQEVFGTGLTSDYVEENKELFEQLAQGGEIAEQAYQKIGEDMAEKYLEGLDIVKNGTLEIEEVMNLLPDNISIGATADISEAIRNLNLVGEQADAVKTAMQLSGYTVEYQWETVWVGDNNKSITYKTKPDGPRDGNNSYTQQEVVAGAIVKKRSASGSGFSSSGGGGGSKGKNENPYDKLHNTLREINDLLRERERLERRYQRLVDHGLATAEKLNEVGQRNIENQREEIEKQKDFIAGRQAQINSEIATNKEMAKYVYTEKDQLGNESIRIDWGAISAITDEKERERVDDFYSKIDEWLESIYGAQEAILDAEDAVWEELQKGKDEYLDLEEQVKQAIIDQRQEEIDNLMAINESINDTNSKIIESMQSQIDKYRQDRENQKTEEELSDKQRRLSYLQQDTSGANGLEIMELQKEIDQGQQDYTDTLIDQKISELQEQNDKATEQRQQQIDIMQQQLDEYSESSRIWTEVSQLIERGTSATEGIVSGSELESLLKSSSAFEGMSKIQQMDWLTQINNQIASALAWMSNGAYTTMAQGDKVTFTNKDGQVVTGTINDRGEIIADYGAIYTDVNMDAYGNLVSSQTAQDAIAERNRQAEEEQLRRQQAAWDEKFPHGIVPSAIGRELKKGDKGTDVAALQNALYRLGYTEVGMDDGDFGDKTVIALKRFQKDQNLSQSGKFNAETKEKFKLASYKTGGLANFTGPAWLDGTKSKPEYVLNADQTKAFFTLVDVLSSLQTKDSKEAQNNGDRTYDIDINVESISSDYDVEQLANTIKHLINEDAHYRNNNAINLMR